MNKLLSFEFRNAFDHLYVKLMPLILLLFGIAGGLLNAADIKANNIEIYPQMEELPQFVTMLAEVITLIGGLLLSKDFTQNTIRNKIIIGHSRTKIYLAKQIMVTTVYLVNIVLFYAGYAVSNILALGTDNLSRSGFAKVTVLMLVSYFCFSLFACFLSMTVKNSLGGALPLLAAYGVLFISAFREIFRNKITEYAAEVLPLGTLIQSSVSMPYPHLLRNCILMICFSAASFAAGLAIFRKTNLN